MRPQAADLFGQTVRRTTGNGYAGSPGAGPDGETCSSCAHIRRHGNGGSKTWRKCGHRLGRISSCTATDILASAPACEFWEQP